jgi:D-alanine-D-alanine ligase
MTTRSFDFGGVVLVADIIRDRPPGRRVHQRSDLEMSEESTVETLSCALTSLGLVVHHYESPASLGLNAAKHSDDLVLSIYGGRESRNRMALVPAVCEAYGLRYMGPDTYGRIVCQDKEISKNLAKSCGLSTPRWRILRRPTDVEFIDTFTLPFVAKPLLEGSSIGISSRNLVRSANEGIALSLELLRTFNQPVMIEEFVPGREVSFNCIESSPTWVSAYSEIAVEGDPSYFDEHMFDADEKQYRRLPRGVRTIDEQLDCADRACLEALLSLIRPFGYCRVDGKHLNERFVFLEITPDAWIAPRGAFAASFMNRGMSYEEVIALILASAPPVPLNQSANGSGTGDGKGSEA